jgi:hypothetical protein
MRGSSVQSEESERPEPVLCTAMYSPVFHMASPGPYTEERTIYTPASFASDETPVQRRARSLSPSASINLSATPEAKVKHMAPTALQTHNLVVDKLSQAMQQISKLQQDNYRLNATLHESDSQMQDQLETINKLRETMESNERTHADILRDKNDGKESMLLNQEFQKQLEQFRLPFEEVSKMLASLTDKEDCESTSDDDKDVQAPKEIAPPDTSGQANCKRGNYSYSKLAFDLSLSILIFFALMYMFVPSLSVGVFNHWMSPTTVPKVHIQLNQCPAMTMNSTQMGMANIAQREALLTKHSCDYPPVKECAPCPELKCTLPEAKEVGKTDTLQAVTACPPCQPPHKSIAETHTSTKVECKKICVKHCSEFCYKQDSPLDADEGKLKAKLQMTEKAKLAVEAQNLKLQTLLQIAKEEAEDAKTARLAADAENARLAGQAEANTTKLQKLLQEAQIAKLVVEAENTWLVAEAETARLAAKALEAEAETTRLTLEANTKKLQKLLEDAKTVKAEAEKTRHKLQMLFEAETTARLANAENAMKEVEPEEKDNATRNATETENTSLAEKAKLALISVGMKLKEIVARTLTGNAENTTKEVAEKKDNATDTRNATGNAENTTKKVAEKKDNATRNATENTGLVEKAKLAYVKLTAQANIAVQTMTTEVKKLTDRITLCILGLVFVSLVYMFRRSATASGGFYDKPLDLTQLGQTRHFSWRQRESITFDVPAHLSAAGVSAPRLSYYRSFTSQTMKLIAEYRTTHDRNVEAYFQSKNLSTKKEVQSISDDTAYLWNFVIIAYHWIWKNRIDHWEKGAVLPDENVHGTESA